MIDFAYAADALYIHVPFCAGKCPYCDFYSLGKFSSCDLSDYADALCRSVAYLPKKPLKTVYFGGGTPSLLRAQDLGRILEKVANVCGFSTDVEITMEANLGGNFGKKLPDFAAAGINRLSLGLQSSQPDFLRLLGRRHSAQDAASAVAAARKSGIDNISLDLMWALPDQTLAQVEQDIRFCGDLGVPHISAYLLKVEAGTPFDRQNLLCRCPDEDTQAELYLHGVATLASLGYAQYEISNFARPGFQSRHNTVYWKCRPYYGMGPSAHGFTGTIRYYFPADLSAFLAAQNPWTLVASDGSGGDFEEHLMLGLRLTEGINLDALSEKFPKRNLSSLRQQIPQLASHGLVHFDGTRLSLTPAGMLLSNQIIGALLDAV